MMELKESGEYCKREEDKQPAFKQFTQCSAFRHTDAIQGSKVEHRAGGSER